MIPPTVTVADRALQVRRAWPSREGVTLELRDGPHIVPARLVAGEVMVGRPGEDPRLVDLAALARRGTVVSHRAGRRAVVRAADGSRFTKVVRRGRAASVLGAITRAEPFGRAFAMPAVLDSTDASVTFAAAPGLPLHQLGAELPPLEWEVIWATFARQWRTAVTCGPLPAEVHDAEAEAAVVCRWADQVTWLDEDLTRLADRAVGPLLSGPADPCVPTHRDLHDKQLLWDPAHGLWLLDVDTVCAAEPALDLGNLRAHATLRELQGLWSPVHAAVVRRTADGLAELAGVDAGRLRAYERSAELRLGCVYAFRPAWTSVAARLRRLADT